MTNLVEDRIVFVDLETMGSEKHTTPIIEIGVTITNYSLKILQEKNWLVPLAAQDRILEIDPVVLEMHLRNGLWEDLRNGKKATSPADLDNSVLRWIQQQTGIHSYQRIPLAGSGVCHFDRVIMERLMPYTARIFTYWELDQGSARRIFSLLGNIPPFYAAPTKNHRALDDNRQVIEEMRSMIGFMQHALGIKDTENILYDSREEPASLLEDEGESV